MKRTIAIWKPDWYELDQSVTVDATETFLFVTSGQPLKFATNLESGEWLEVKIISIKNKEIGNIAKIDTEGLTYKFYFDASNFIRIEAEETPGKFENGDKVGQYLSDNEFIVEIEFTSQDASLRSA